MEQLTLKKMREMVGWPNGEGDGLFSPGMCVCVYVSDRQTVKRERKRESVFMLQCVFSVFNVICV